MTRARPPVTAPMTTTLAALAALACLAALPGPARAAQPITLDEALAMAGRQSHDLVIARADADLAGADTLSAYGGVLPRLDLSASTGHQFFGPGTEQGFDLSTGRIITGASDFASYGYQLQLTQSLVDLGSWRTIAQARASQQAAARTYDEQRLAVAFDVTRRYFELLKAQRSLQVLEKAAERSEELVARADALFTAGRAQKLDTFTARVNLGNDRIAVEQGRSRVVQARADLATVLGQAGDSPIEVVAPQAVDAPGLPAGEPPPLADLLAAARARRPALAAAGAQVEAATQGVGAAQAGLLPTLGLSATFGRSESEAFGANGAFDDPTRRYTASVGVGLSWNLFEGRRTQAAVRRAELSAEKARAGAARTADAVASEVATSRAAVVTLARQVAFSADNLSAAEQGLSLARQRLEAGLASQLEVRDATLKLTQAELSLVQARIDHAVAAADLNRAVGGAL